MSNSSATPWTVPHQDPLSMEFPRQEYWSELPFPSPGDLPTKGSNSCLLHWQADSLPLSHAGKTSNRVRAKSFQLCPTLCEPMDYSLPGSSVHRILQARILEWVAISSSRGYSQPRSQTQISSIAGRFFTNWAMREAPGFSKCPVKNKTKKPKHLFSLEKYGKIACRYNHLCYQAIVSTLPFGSLP